MSGGSYRWEGAGGNREVSPLSILRACRDMRAAGAQAYLREEGGSRGKPGFPLATEPKAEETEV